jgi:3-dehydroquinate dehydratase-2
MKKIAIINGPTLNLLGHREKNIYGEQSLEALNQQLQAVGKNLNISLEFLQSNIEGELVNAIQGLINHCECIIINAGAYTHTSIAIRDALLAVALPFIEVHISNLKQREAFRQKSYLSDIASGVIHGFGLLGYELALYAAAKIVVSAHNQSPTGYNTIA